MCLIDDEQCTALTGHIKNLPAAYLSAHGVNTLYGNDPAFCRIAGDFLSQVTGIVVPEKNDPIFKQSCRHHPGSMILLIHKKHIVLSYQCLHQ